MRRLHQLLLCLLPTCFLAKDFKIDVAPGAGEKQIKNKAEMYPCRFFYAAQGGTNEGWTMSINRLSDKAQYSCKVFRPSADSYLYFENIKVKGCKLCNVLSWAAYDNAGQLTDESIFTVHKNFILSAESFKNEIASLEIKFEWPKEEL